MFRIYFFMLTYPKICTWFMLLSCSIFMYPEVPLKNCERNFRNDSRRETSTPLKFHTNCNAMIALPLFNAIRIFFSGLSNSASNITRMAYSGISSRWKLRKSLQTKKIWRKRISSLLVFNQHILSAWGVLYTVKVKINLKLFPLVIFNIPNSH